MTEAVIVQKPMDWFLYDNGLRHKKVKKAWLKQQRQDKQKQRPEVFYKKDALKNSAKFTGKQLRQSLFFSKFAGLRPASLSKKRLQHFSVNFANSLRTPSLQNTPVRLLTDKILFSNPWYHPNDQTYCYRHHQYVTEQYISFWDLQARIRLQTLIQTYVFAKHFYSKKTPSESRPQ